MAARRIVVVPHTHWDREWYQPIQSFRLSLVETIDSLLELLESDPAFEHFTFDGQMAMVDDYLEIRPENEERLRALAAAGRVERRQVIEHITRRAVWRDHVGRAVRDQQLE